MKAFLSGGVDTFPDNADAVHRTGRDGRTDERRQQYGVRVKFPLRERFAQTADVVRRRAATSADNRRVWQTVRQCRREILRPHVVLSGYGVGQSGVRLCDDRKARIFRELPQERRHTVRACGAVQADGVRAQSLQRPGHRRHRTARERPARLVKGHRDEYGKVCILLDRQ